MIATAPAAAPSITNIPLPPSERDFEVYRRTAVEGRTTREAAAEFNISQTRVMQLREKVFEWIGNHVPPLARLEPAERLRVAQTLACEQLQHQYDEAMHAWRTSATAVHVTRYVGRSLEDGVTMVKESQGDPRYLRLATQISKAISKLGMATVPNPETALPVAALQTASVEGADHPQGDCSENGALEPMSQPAATSQPSAKPEMLSVSSSAAERKSVPLSPPEDATQTVQAIVEQLENVPQRERKERKRDAMIRRELFGQPAPPRDLVAALAASRSS